MLQCHFRYRMVDAGIDNIKSFMDISGLSRNSVNKLFHNRKIVSVKLETLMKICDALNCSLSELIEYVPDKTEATENHTTDI